MSRYSNIDHIMGLPFLESLELLTKAYEKRNEDLLFQRWLMHYEGQISFNEFKGQMINHETNNTKTKEEILADVENIIKATDKGR